MTRQRIGGLLRRPLVALVALVAAGVVVLFAAFAGLAFKKEYDLSLAPGASFSAVERAVALAQARRVLKR